MKRELRSNAAMNFMRRSHWLALGLSEEDMEKPKIAVVNSSSELAVCFSHLDEIAKKHRRLFLIVHVAMVIRTGFGRQLRAMIVGR